MTSAMTELDSPTITVFMYGRIVSLPRSNRMYFHASSVGWKSTNGM